MSVYDFNAGRWTLGPPLMHPREHLAAVAAGGSVWALGGRALGIGSFAYVERYTPGRQAWDEMAPLPVARGGFEAVAVGDSILAVGGEDGPETVSEVDRLDLHSGRWTQTPPLAPARHGLGVIADGPLVFAIDGGASSGLTTSHVVQRLRLK